MVRISRCRSPLGEDDDRFFAERLAHLLGRLVGGGVGSTRVPTPASVGIRVAPTAAATASTQATASTARACPAAHAATRPNGSVPGAQAQSIESGPLTSALRNWFTNGFSESNSSSFGPDSTILPLQSTAMKSAIRRAVSRSWLITR